MESEVASPSGNVSQLEIFNRIVLDLNVRWQVFDELYSSPENLPVFDRTGKMFWDHLWNFLLEDLFMAISRFFDPAKNHVQDNFSLLAVLEFPEVAPFRDNLKKLIDEMRPIWERGIKQWRHKKLSHWDMEVALGLKRLPDVPTADVKELVRQISGFAREIEHKLNNRDVSFGCSLTQWVPQVLRYLKLGIERMDEKMDKKYHGGSTSES